VVKPSLEVHANPFSPEAQLRYEVGQEGRISIHLSNMNGEVLRVLQEDVYRHPGAYELVFPTDLPAGIYFVKLRYADGTVQEKLMLSERREIADKIDLAPIAKQLQVSVRPNPFRHEFKLRIERPIPEMKRATIRIMDVNGRIFLQQFDAPFDEDISISTHSGWPSGVYIIRVSASEYTHTSTIVKQ
jgi:hypothetical protein